MAHAVRAAPLHHAPAATAQLLHVAVERGLSRARLALRPAELGGIEIRLAASAAGISAHIVADSPEAARLLGQAADDLRRSLERHDLDLLALDVSTANEDRAGGSAGASADRDAGRSTLAGDGRGPHRPGGAAGEEDPLAPVATVTLPDGVLVDVLA